MEWKSFKHAMPKVCEKIIIRHKTVGNPIIQFSQIKRPYDVNKTKYNENYHMIQMDGTWIDLCEDFKQEYQWLDPYEDRKIKP